MGYKYFLDKFGNYYSDVYRIPNNGERIYKNIPNLEKYMAGGKWSNESKDIKPLLEEISTGNFSETSDEIPEDKALEIMKSIDKKSTENK